MTLLGTRSESLATCFDKALLCWESDWRMFAQPVADCEVLGDGVDGAAEDRSPAADILAASTSWRKP